MTHCTTHRLLFHQHEKREVTAAFDGGRITSDGGGVLLREVEQRFGIVRSFVGCFTDHREPEAIEFNLPELLAQRVMGLALGYEDLNDHDELRHWRCCADGGISPETTAAMPKTGANRWPARAPSTGWN